MPGMAWLGMGPQLMINRSRLTRATRCAKNAIAQLHCHMILHFIITSLSDRNSGPNYGHKSMTSCTDLFPLMTAWYFLPIITYLISLNLESGLNIHEIHSFNN